MKQIILAKLLVTSAMRFGHSAKVLESPAMKQVSLSMIHIGPAMRHVWSAISQVIAAKPRFSLKTGELIHTVLPICNLHL